MSVPLLASGLQLTLHASQIINLGIRHEMTTTFALVPAMALDVAEADRTWPNLAQALLPRLLKPCLFLSQSSRRGLLLRASSLLSNASLLFSLLHQLLLKANLPGCLCLFDM